MTVSSQATCSAATAPLKVYMIAGEPSGDQLGGKLMAALRQACGENISIEGVGGEAMIAQGLKPPFPLSEIVAIGPAAILRRLPQLRCRLLQTVQEVLAADPDVIVIIDSPEFTHRVASRVRKVRPDIPIVNYVSPTVWAWRPGRAKKMKPYVDHILALLPFEPAAHERLDGPECSYVGHPLVDRFSWIDGLDEKSLAARLGLNRDHRVLVVLPGSRPTEVSRLMPPFGEVLNLLHDHIGPFETLLPVVPSVRNLVEEQLPNWQRTVHLLHGDEDKFKAFRLADAALAASGTVTLELAVSGTPMVVAYRVDPITAWIAKRLIQTPTAVLPNIILGQKAFPEFIQNDCTAPKLTSALRALMENGPARKDQLCALKEIRRKMAGEGFSPSDEAARIVLDEARSGPGISTSASTR